MPRRRSSVSAYPRETRSGHTRWRSGAVHPDQCASAQGLAKRVARLYRKRWTLETAFEHLKRTSIRKSYLGYPKAALFGFCLALVGYNMLAVVLRRYAACMALRSLTRNSRSTMSRTTSPKPITA